MPLYGQYTTVPTNLVPEQWTDNFFKEYIRTGFFSKYYGTSPTDVIQVREDLVKKSGEKVWFELINRLTGAGVSGSTVLVGNEEKLSQRSFGLTVAQYRHAVEIADFEQQKTLVDLLDAGKDLLMDWAQEHTRDKIIAALSSINGVLLTASTDTQRNAWLVDNADRVLFGAARSNNAANDYSDCMATIDTTNDKLTYSVVSLAKRMAKLGTPRVRPLRTKSDGQEWYVMFAPSYAFRDLKGSLATINQNAEVRGSQNPLFTDGDLVWDGVIIREVPEIPVIAQNATYNQAVGNVNAPVAPCYLVGGQALGLAWARRWQPIRRSEDDYGDKIGVGVRGTYNVDKLTFGTNASTETDDQKDNGMVTVYVSGAGD